MRFYEQDFLWIVQVPITQFQSEVIFLDDNASFHSSKFTCQFFEHKGFTTENQWSIAKTKLYEGGKQYNCKACFWEAMLEIETSEVKRIFKKSMDNDCYWEDSLY